MAKSNPAAIATIPWRGRKIHAKTQWGFHRVEFSVAGVDRGKWHGFYWFTHQGGKKWGVAQRGRGSVMEVARGLAGRQWQAFEKMHRHMTRLVLPWKFETRSKWWWTVKGYTTLYEPIEALMEDAFMELYGEENVESQVLEADYLNRVVYADDVQAAELRRGFLGW